ncbi:MAG TPA: hypothetical protein VFQ53_25255 [Kofleriaceae bacterium]|nr:hypothetical protein [Kofleriaceae bacterium]
MLIASRPVLAIPAAAASFYVIVDHVPAGFSPLYLQIPVAFAIGAVAIAVAGRWLPERRDHVHLAIGIALFAWLAGVQYVLAITALTWAVDRYAPRLHPHVAMAAVVVTALVAARGFVLYPPAHPRLVGLLAGIAVLRLVYFAFEVTAIPPHRRSFVRLLVYGPFCVPMTFGPRQVSYSDFMTEHPVTWESGSVQLFRGLLKWATALALLHVLHRVLPDPRALVAAGWWLRLYLLFQPYLVVALLLGAAADIGAGLSRWAGYGVPDEFNWNVLATSPVDWWTRSNLNLLQFLRRAFIFPALRLRRSMVLAVVVGSSAAFVYHVLRRLIAAGPGMDDMWRAELTLLAFVPMPAMLLFGLVMDRAFRAVKRVRLARPGFVVVTQLLMAAYCFPNGFGGPALGYARDRALTYEQNVCGLRSIVFGRGAGDPDSIACMRPAATTLVTTTHRGP